MAIDKLIHTASRMYGISFIRSKAIIEQLLQENDKLSESEILRMIGQKSLFYLS